MTALHTGLDRGSFASNGRRLLYLKLACGCVCLAILLSNALNISRWTEHRGVYDDLCYLRQAHLFQRFGLAGFNTDIALDDDHYFASLSRSIGYPDWNDPSKAVCHIEKPATGKRVIQYPPGVGFLLAMFPSGYQVIPLYVTATALVALMALLAIALATTVPTVMMSAVFGWTALYFMINPTKSSYSLAPTMVICAAAGALTAVMFMARAQTIRVFSAALAGLLIGISVDMRLPNLLLAGGYALLLMGLFLVLRRREPFYQGALFAIAFLLGLVPTLAANAINAGSPFKTTYGSGDAVLPDFTFSIAAEYLKNLQGWLILLAIGWLIGLFRAIKDRAVRTVVFLTAANLVVNLLFFLSHPIYTPYYLMPIAMLSLWTLLFTVLLQDRRSNIPRLQ